MGDTGNACKALTGRTEVNVSAHRWEVNVKSDINESEWQGVDWIQLPLHVVGCCEAGDEQCESRCFHNVMVDKPILLGCDAVSLRNWF